MLVANCEISRFCIFLFFFVVMDGLGIGLLTILTLDTTCIGIGVALALQLPFALLDIGDDDAGALAPTTNGSHQYWYPRDSNNSNTRSGP